jgi:hypothetical protein
VLTRTLRSIAEGDLERSADLDQLLAKFRILNAYFLPGVSHRHLYPSITPVNSFRLVFNLYFHAGLPLLPDDVWAKQQHPPTFVNIGSLLRQQE